MYLNSTTSNTGHTFVTRHSTSDLQISAAHTSSPDEVPQETPSLASPSSDSPSSSQSPRPSSYLSSFLSFREPSKNIKQLRLLALQGRQETLREELAEGREKVVWGSVDELPEAEVRQAEGGDDRDRDGDGSDLSTQIELWGLCNAGFNYNIVGVFGSHSDLSTQIELWGLRNAGFNYNIVGVFGSQSTGKSAYQTEGEQTRSATIYPDGDAIISVLNTLFFSDLPYSRIDTTNLLIVDPYKSLANIDDICSGEHEERHYKVTTTSFAPPASLTHLVTQTRLKSMAISDSGRRDARPGTRKSLLHDI
ncbi:hypothetical protein L210DRAFT_3649587 [Boletus edulis BED1]|uniref:Uncharacterized protein n=1 Tax=Boletus edulis BED1 TaxID=1328754 RepID=A0AAD4GBI2_BOLED|nr:hypothetical protein L210DRAFT_3649587 [Boletus edulis BED1]